MQLRCPWGFHFSIVFLFISGGGAHAQYACGSLRTTLWSHFFHSTFMSSPGIWVRLSGFPASTFTHWAILLTSAHGVLQVMENYFFLFATAASHLSGSFPSFSFMVTGVTGPCKCFITTEMQAALGTISEAWQDEKVYNLVCPGNSTLRFWPQNGQELTVSQAYTHRVITQN